MPVVDTAVWEDASEGMLARGRHREDVPHSLGSQEPRLPAYEGAILEKERCEVREALVWAVVSQSLDRYGVGSEARRVTT